MRRPTRTRRIFLAFTTAWFFYFGLILIAPLLVMLRISFQKRNFSGGIGAGLTATAWRQIASPQVIRVFAESIHMALIAGALCTLIGFFVAWTIYRRSTPHRQILVGLLVLPLFINPLLIAFGWQVLLGRSGPLTSLLSYVGFSSAPDILFTPMAVQLGLVAAYFPYFTVMVWNSLEEIEPGLIWAAKDLGASEFAFILDVAIPHALPAIVIGWLLIFLPVIGEFIIPDILGGGKIFLYGNYSAFLFFEGRNWPLGAALVITGLLFGLIVVAVASKWTQGPFKHA